MASPESSYAQVRRVTHPALLSFQEIFRRVPHPEVTQEQLAERFRVSYG